MKFRKRMSKGASRREFRRSASRTNKKNVARMCPRGGIRL